MYRLEKPVDVFYEEMREFGHIRRSRYYLYDFYTQFLSFIQSGKWPPAPFLKLTGVPDCGLQGAAPEHRQVGFIRAQN